jgi:hypothetical protein
VGGLIFGSPEILALDPSDKFDRLIMGPKVKQEQVKLNLGGDLRDELTIDTDSIYDGLEDRLKQYGLNSEEFQSQLWENNKFFP